MTLTLTREEAQQVLDALEAALSDDQPYIVSCKQTVETLRARLAQPEPEPVADKYLMEVECTKCGAKQDGVLTVTAPPQRERVQFPTMLRKMWSGGEVQAWLDENVNKEKNA